MRAFAQAERFVSEIEGKRLRPAYVFVGDEVFFRKRIREAILEHLVPGDVRDFSWFDFDLADTDVTEILDRARTPSLMAPFQVFFVRGVKTLFGRGSNEEKLAAIEEYCKSPIRTRCSCSWRIISASTSAAVRRRGYPRLAADARPARGRLRAPLRSGSSTAPYRARTRTLRLRGSLARSCPGRHRGLPASGRRRGGGPPAADGP